MSDKRVIAPSNLEAMLDRVHGNKELLAEVVAVFAREVEKHHARMEKALDGHDASEITRIAHGFKGVLGTMEADEAYHLALNLEKAGQEKRFDEAQLLFAALMEQVDHLVAYFSDDQEAS